MSMKVSVSVALEVMDVRHGLHHNGNEIDLAVRNPALSHHSLGKLTYHRGVAAKHGQFKAVFMIEMNMHGRDLQIVMCVMGIC